MRPEDIEATLMYYHDLTVFLYFLKSYLCSFIHNQYSRGSLIWSVSLCWHCWLLRGGVYLSLWTWSSWRTKSTRNIWQKSVDITKFTFITRILFWFYSKWFSWVDDKFIYLCLPSWTREVLYPNCSSNCWCHRINDSSFY